MIELIVKMIEKMQISNEIRIVGDDVKSLEICYIYTSVLHDLCFLWLLNSSFASNVVKMKGVLAKIVVSLDSKYSYDQKQIIIMTFGIFRQFIQL